MQSALKLAEKGISSVEPNPAVGCVIVKAGQVIGKGYHKKFGGPHAEVNAIDGLPDARRDAGRRDHVRHAGAVLPPGQDRPVHGSHHQRQDRAGSRRDGRSIGARQRQGSGATAAGRDRGGGRALRAGGQAAQRALLQTRDDGQVLGRAEVGPEPRRQAGLRGSVGRETLDHERGQPQRCPPAAAPGRGDPGGDQHGPGGRSAA